MQSTGRHTGVQLCCSILTRETSPCRLSNRCSAEALFICEPAHAHHPHQKISAQQPSRLTARNPVAACRLTLADIPSAMDAGNNLQRKIHGWETSRGKFNCRPSDTNLAHTHSHSQGSSTAGEHFTELVLWLLSTAPDHLQRSRLAAHLCMSMVCRWAPLATGKLRWTLLTASA